MKKKALLKDTLREIRKSFGRFFSIFAIVGIGVAFFAGVRDSVPVMKNTADTYFDDYNFMDLKIMSTIGMTRRMFPLSGRWMEWPACMAATAWMYSIRITISSVSTSCCLIR